MNRKDQIINSLLLLDEFFNSNNISYWLEAGTALSAYRDGKVFSWDHDIDIGIWRNDVPSIERIRSFFKSKGFEVIFQKNFPFLDNIIQLRTSSSNKNLFDVDIYLYSRKDNFAYMRWLQKPEGILGPFKQRLIFILRNLSNPKNKKWEGLSRLFPKKIIRIVFKFYLVIHIKTSKCIFHRFPENFFSDLRKINFYGLKINIPKQTEEFLSFRYGEDWAIPDSQYNQKAKWKSKSKARVLLEMSILPNPVFDYKNL